MFKSFEFFKGMIILIGNGNLFFKMYFYEILFYVFFIMCVICVVKGVYYYVKIGFKDFINFREIIRRLII